MGGLLAELGKKLAERWLSLLILPGALYVAVWTLAWILGHEHPFNVHRIDDRIQQWQTSGHTTAADRLTVILPAVLLAAAAAGLSAQALGSLTERIWLADHWRRWPRPLRPLAERQVEHRRKMWSVAIADYESHLERERAARADSTTRDDERPDSSERAEAWHRVARIADIRPDRPGWIGDRLNATAVRVDRDYLLDLPTIWPHLWLVMPETARTEITTARGTLTRAATLNGWGILYLPVAILWWPALLISAAITATARRRARTAADTYALLVEAAIRLYTTDLAKAVGIEHTGPLDTRTGWRLTLLLQGKQNLIPLTPLPPGPLSGHTRQDP